MASGGAVAVQTVVVGPAFDSRFTDIPHLSQFARRKSSVSRHYIRMGALEYIEGFTWVCVLVGRVQASGKAFNVGVLEREVKV